MAAKREVQDIIDQIVAIQKGINPPRGQKKIQVATDEPPANFGAFPLLLNLEEELTPDDAVGSASAGRVDRWRIAMHLIFGTADRKYGVRERRPWVNRLRDTFRLNPRLNGAVISSRIVSVLFQPLRWNEVDYTAATFILEAHADPDAP